MGGLIFYFFLFLFFQCLLCLLSSVCEASAPAWNERIFMFPLTYALQYLAESYLQPRKNLHGCEVRHRESIFCSLLFISATIADASSWIRPFREYCHRAAYPVQINNHLYRITRNSVWCLTTATYQEVAPRPISTLAEEILSTARLLRSRRRLVINYECCSCWHVVLKSRFIANSTCCTVWNCLFWLIEADKTTEDARLHRELWLIRAKYRFKDESLRAP